MAADLSQIQTGWSTSQTWDSFLCNLLPEGMVEAAVGIRPARQM